MPRALARVARQVKRVGNVRTRCSEFVSVYKDPAVIVHRIKMHKRALAREPRQHYLAFQVVIAKRAQ